MSLYLPEICKGLFRNLMNILYFLLKTCKMQVGRGGDISFYVDNFFKSCAYSIPEKLQESVLEDIKGGFKISLTEGRF